MKFFKRLPLLLGLLPLLQPLRAAEPADPSLKLREQLRGVTLQLRTAQTESANAQAAAAIADQKSKDLAVKIAGLEKRVAAQAKQAAADQTAATATATALEEKLAAETKKSATLAEGLENWKEGYRKAAAVANDKEDQRARLAGELTAARQLVADRERKNVALFNTSNEILDRFENYALGKALAAREPFIGTTRVKVENLVQGYKDRILDHRIAAPATPAAKR